MRQLSILEKFSRVLNLIEIYFADFLCNKNSENPDDTHCLKLFFLGITFQLQLHGL